MDTRSKPGADAPIARRRSLSPETVNLQTINWLAGLPSDLRPRLLPVQFTHVANTLGHLWSRPDDCLAYFEELLLDRRGNRSGFPLKVAMELAGLKNHLETQIRHVPQTAWEEIIERRIA